jgi:prevent-host-death family protein
MSSTIGLRELKNNLSATIRRVRGGQSVRITDRNRPIAELRPLGETDVTERLRFLVRAGRLSWSGGKPSGLPRGPVVRGVPVSKTVVEDRR